MDLKNGRVRIVDFVSTLGYDMMASIGKSCEAIRSIDLDDGPRQQKVLQNTERLAEPEWIEFDVVFIRPGVGQYHPMNLSRLLADLYHRVGCPAADCRGSVIRVPPSCSPAVFRPKVAAERSATPTHLVPKPLQPRDAHHAA